MQFGSLDLILQALPDGDGQVLGGRNDLFEFRNFEIQMAVVVYVDYLALDHFFELFEVDDKARNGVYLALYGDFQGVVVAMPISIRALAEKTQVFLRRQLV
jgi:hypothetical protein